MGYLVLLALAGTEMDFCSFTALSDFCPPRPLFSVGPRMSTAANTPTLNVAREALNQKLKFDPLVFLEGSIIKEKKLGRVLSINSILCAGLNIH